MEKSTFRWIGILAGVFIAMVFSIKAVGVERLSAVTEPPRADVITLDAMKVFGSLSRPPVEFLHDRHTEALEKKNKDCLSCHLKKDDVQSTKFMRTGELGQQALMDLYHLNCIACHRDTTAAGEKSGPVVCGNCHSGTSDVVSVRKPMGMDRSLHFRHVKAQNKKCETCHHVYDEQTKKLVYAKGKEGTCRYCHGEETVENRISMREASHLSCVACHQRLEAKKKKAGPIQCSGCHDPLEQQMIERLATIPRVERNHPDQVFVKTGVRPNPGEDRALRMNLVPFNHKAHETYNDTCRVCHHAEMTSCSECHVIGGSEKGNYINLQMAFHQLRNEQSCLGCHDYKQNEKACIGCHRVIPKVRKQDTESCLACHMTPPAGIPVEELRPDNKTLAAQMLKDREPTVEAYPQADIPETVTIGGLSNLFEPAILPHRKIFNALLQGTRDNDLAKYFHDNPGTLCQGCHHHSPPSKKPPKCASCHGKPFNEKDLFKPGLAGAYHRQCMECHAAMDLKKPDSRECASCHKEKK